MEYVVYLTYYTGTKLPPFYIGSSTKEKIVGGYNGSVTSKKWQSIYKLEQQINKPLFKTRILSYHTSRIEAIQEELRLQKLHKVVNSSKYFNEAYAAINGCFGRDVSGALHPMYGKTHSKETKALWSKNRKGAIVSEKTKQRLSEARKGKPGKPHTEATKEKLRLINLKKKHTEATKKKMSNAHKGKKFSDDRKAKLSKSSSNNRNSQFKGYCVYNNQTYISTKLSTKLGISTNLVNSICKINNNRPITSQSYTYNKYLRQHFKKEEVLGKTWKDLGFGFIPKDETNG